MVSKQAVAKQPVVKQPVDKQAVVKQLENRNSQLRSKADPGEFNKEH